MAQSKLAPNLEAIRIKYDLAASDFWELPQRKGTWIVKHMALEAIAGMEGIQFDPPQIIEASTKDGIAVMAVRASMTTGTGIINTWATGEASPGNNKNQYPWAMAEKRAKDRVILKLTGIEAYSEDEADDFKQNARQTSTDAPETASATVSDSTAKLIFPALQSELQGSATRSQLEGAWERWLTVIVHWSDSMQEHCEDARQQMVTYLAEHGGDAREANRDIIEADLRIAMNMDDLKAKWSGWGPAMKKLAPTDVAKLSEAKEQVKKAILNIGGTMPAFDALTPEEQHAVKIAATP